MIRADQGWACAACGISGIGWDQLQAHTREHYELEHEAYASGYFTTSDFPLPITLTGEGRPAGRPDTSERLQRLLDTVEANPPRCMADLHTAIALAFDAGADEERGRITSLASQHAVEHWACVCQTLLRAIAGLPELRQDDDGKAW